MNYYNIFPSDVCCFLLLLVKKKKPFQAFVQYLYFSALGPSLEHKMKDQQQETTVLECLKIHAECRAFSLFSFSDWFISVSVFCITKKSACKCVYK